MSISDSFEGSIGWQRNAVELVDGGLGGKPSRCHLLLLDRWIVDRSRQA
jgi:hypothetical protein